MNYLKIITLIVSLFFLGQTFLIKKLVGTYLSPGGLFSFFWFIFSFFPLILLPSIPINPLGITFILTCTIFFNLSTIFFDWKNALAINRSNKIVSLAKLNSKFSKWLLILCFVSSILFSSLSVISNGFGIKLFITDFIGASARYAALRGNEYLDYGIYGTLGVFFTYFGALLGAIILSLTPKKRNIVIFLSIFPSVFAMLTQSSKLIFFIAVIFFVSSTFLLRIFKDEKFILKRSDMIRLFKIAIIFIPILFIAFISREGYNDFSNTQEAANLILPAVASYFFGSFYAFCDYYAFYMGSGYLNNYDIDVYNYGYYSFKAIYDTFGGNKYFPPGFYADYYIYKDSLATNIYTAFRGFIQDFGTIGCLVFMFAFGLFSNLCFYLLLVRKKPWLYCGIYITMVAFVCLSFLISIFTARYVFLLSIALIIYLFINDLISPSLAQISKKGK